MGTLRRWRPGGRSPWLVLAGVLIFAIGILTGGVLTVKAYPLVPTTLTTGGLSLPISTSVSLPVSTSLPTLPTIGTTTTTTTHTTTTTQTLPVTTTRTTATTQTLPVTTT